jgi:peptide/nickel transport system substrate-binding protein
MRKPALLILMIWLLATLLGLVACAAPLRVAAPVMPAPQPTGLVAAKQGRGAGDTLHILFWQAPSILNPHLTQEAKDWQACRLTLEPLASYDKDGNLIPFLAAEIPTVENGGVAADGKSVTWKLKPGVKWSDGEPFTADDVLFTYQFVSDPAVGASTYATSYSAVKEVVALDAQTVQVRFKDINPAWSLPFVGLQGAILPRHAFVGYEGDRARQAPANLKPIGTGPYRVIEFEPQEVLFLGNELIQTNRIIYEPNPYFREPDKPYFGKVELKGGGTVNEAGREVMQIGDVDYAYNLQLDNDTLDKLSTGQSGQLVSLFGAYTERLLLNRTDPNKATSDGERASMQFPNPFFDDPLVRQAFTLAIDRAAIAGLYGQTGRPATNMLVSPQIYASPNTHYEYDSTRAKALLEQAGWVDSNGDGVREKDGRKLSVSFQTSVNSLRQQTQQIVKRNLEAVGVQVELLIIDSSQFFGHDTANPNTRWQFYADMEMFSLANHNPDPGDYMGQWTCDQISQKANNWTGYNIERYCSSAYDELYRRSTTEMNADERRKLFIAMNDMLIEDVVMIPLVHRADISGASKTLTGIDLTPWDAEFWNIKDWRRSTP